MDIRVTRTTTGSPDGVRTALYRAGEIYGPASEPPMPADLARVFLREGWAVEAAPEAKDLGAAPENKDLGGAPDDAASESDDERPGKRPAVTVRKGSRRARRASRRGGK